MATSLVGRSFFFAHGLRYSQVRWLKTGRCDSSILKETFNRLTAWRPGWSKKTEEQPKILDFEIDPTREVEFLEPKPLPNLPVPDLEKRLKTVVLNIVGEEGSQKEWKNIDVTDIVCKYKILVMCDEEFGVMVPNHLLCSMTTVQDILNYYSELEPPCFKIFKSLDENDLPSNLKLDTNTTLRPAKAANV